MLKLKTSNLNTVKAAMNFSHYNDFHRMPAMLKWWKN